MYIERPRSPSTAPVSVLHRSELREEVVQGFGERWVGEDGIAQRCVREAAHHGELKHAHDLPAFDAEHGAAENRVALAIDDGLHEPAGFRGLQGSRDPRHRHRRDRDAASLRTRLLFRETDAANCGSMKTVYGTRRPAIVADPPS